MRSWLVVYVFGGCMKGLAGCFRKNKLQNHLSAHMMDGFAYHKMIFDVDGKPVDYVFLEVNAAFERLTGLKREKIVGRRVIEAHGGTITFQSQEGKGAKFTVELPT